MSEDIESIIEDTEESLQRVLSGDIDEIELRPQNAYVRRLQHQTSERGKPGLPLKRSRAKPTRASLSRAASCHVAAGR